MYARTTGSDVAHMHGGGGKATRAPTPSNDAAAGTTTTSTNGMNVPMSTPLTSSEATGARQVIATAEAATSTTLTTSTSSGSDTAVFNTPVAGPMVCYCNLLICVWMVYRGDTITSAEFLVGTESWCRQRQGQQCSYFKWAAVGIPPQPQRWSELSRQSGSQEGSGTGSSKQSVGEGRALQRRGQGR